MGNREVVYRVMPAEVGWKVECDGLSYSPILRAEKQQAVSTAILIAQQHEPARVQVKDAAGQIEFERLYATSAL